MRDRRLLDGLIALVLTVALQVHLQVSDQADATALNVASALLLTLPFAARRRAPLLVVLVFAATAALNAILGGGLFDGEPPPLPSLIAGAAMFYSLGVHAENREAVIGALAGVVGFWTALLAKLKLRDRVQAVVLACESGVIAPGDS